MLKAPVLKAAAVLGFLAFGTACLAGEDDEKGGKQVKLPKAVAKSLKAKYPGAKIRGISKEKNAEGEVIYEVEMTVSTKVDVNFDAKGEVEVIERQIGLFELPEAVLKAAAKAFPKGKIVKAETVLEEEGPLNYEVVIELKGKKPFEVLMAGNGKILKNGAASNEAKPKAKKAEKEDEDDDENEDDDDKPMVKKGEKESKKEQGKKAEKDEDEDEDEDDDKPMVKKGEKSERPTASKGKKDKDDDDDDDDDK